MIEGMALYFDVRARGLEARTPHATPTLGSGARILSGALSRQGAQQDLQTPPQTLPVGSFPRP